MSKQQKLKSLSTCWFNFKTKLVESLFFVLVFCLLLFLGVSVVCLTFSIFVFLSANNYQLYFFFYICPINGSFCLSCLSIAQMNMKVFYFLYVSWNTKLWLNSPNLKLLLTYNPKYCLINQANTCHWKFRLLHTK